MSTYGTITHGDDYDIDEWAAWLSKQGIDIDDVQRIRFSGSKMIVYRYANNSEGRRFVRRNGGIAMLRPLRRALLSSPPVWTSA